MRDDDDETGGRLGARGTRYGGRGYAGGVARAAASRTSRASIDDALGGIAYQRGGFWFVSSALDRTRALADCADWTWIR